MDPQTVAEPSPQTRRDYSTRITPETARKFAELRKAAQAKREAVAKEREAQAQENPNLPKYLLDRLARVRGQIDHINNLIEDESDPQKLDRLASALYRFSEIERNLAGRPLPGSLKPSAARSRRQSSSFAPVEPDPPASQ
jgi:hypothetical protein